MDPTLNLLLQCHDRQTDLVLLRDEQLLEGVVAFDQTLRLINGVSQSAVLQQDLRGDGANDHTQELRSQKLSECERTSCELDVLSKLFTSL